MNIIQDVPDSLYKAICNDKYDKVRRGDNVTVSFNLRGREWKGRYFPSLQGWKISVESSSQEGDSIEKNVSPVDESDVPF